MTKNYAFIALFSGLFAVVLGCTVVFGYFDGKEAAFATQEDTSAYVCNGDGRQCPDGSVVGRTGPKCDFSECPGVMPVMSDDLPPGLATLSGRVTLSPTCPVERMPPDPNCAPRAYVTHVYAIEQATGKVFSDAKTTADGGFIFDLRPGTYIIRADGGQVMPTCPDQVIAIKGGTRSMLDISCDSGIR